MNNPENEPHPPRPEEQHTAGEQPAPAHEQAPTADQPTVEQPTAGQAPGGQNTAEQTAAFGAQAPWSGGEYAPPPPASGYPPPGTVPRPGRFRRFAGHRATQLVAAGLAGLLIGGGTVGLIEHFDHGNGRNGHAPYSRFHNPRSGDGFGFNHRGTQGS